MSIAGAQAHTFYRDVARHRRVWTIRDEGGYPAPMKSSGQRAQPFWSSPRRVQKIIKTVPAYAGFEPEEISWEEFRDKWLVGFQRDGLLVGVNWSGPHATGMDLPPDWVRKCVEQSIENLQAG